MPFTLPAELREANSQGILSIGGFITAFLLPWNPDTEFPFDDLQDFVVRVRSSQQCGTDWTCRHATCDST